MSEKKKGQIPSGESVKWMEAGAVSANAIFKRLSNPETNPLDIFKDMELYALMAAAVALLYIGFSKHKKGKAAAA